MAVLWAGTSIADFAWSGTSYNNYTTSGNIALGVIEGILLDNGTLASRAEGTCEFEAVDDFWLAFTWNNPNAATASGASYNLLGFFNKAYSTVNPLLKIQAVSNAMVLHYWNGSSFVVDNTVTGMIDIATIRIDIHIKIADTGGVFAVYKNGNLLANLSTDDTLRVGATHIDMMRLGQYHVNSSNGANRVSGMIIMDGDTREYDLYQRQPNSNGAETAWTGVYTDVAKNNVNDATMITAGTAGLLETYGKVALPSQFADADIGGVILSARARTSDVGINGVIRIGGTNYDKAPEHSPGVAFTPTQYRFDLNPATSGPWSFSAIDGAQTGVKSV